MMAAILFFVLLAEISMAAGQIFFKKGANGFEAAQRDFRSYPAFFARVFKMPLIWYGLLSMTVGLVFWLMALSLGDLSLVFPIGSMQYIIIMVAAHYWLGEKIDSQKLIGTLLVMGGIVLLTLS